MSETVRPTSYAALAWLRSVLEDGEVSLSQQVLVYGASGHTGRFVVDELLRRGLSPVLAGRSAERLNTIEPRGTGLERRVADVEDQVLLQQLVAGVDVVINCAGPFLDTARPLASAAVQAGAHYMDVTAEQQVVQELYRELDVPARVTDVAVVPAMAFFGGLADLLVTAALDGELRADEVRVAVGLDRWWPTAGTRDTGTRNTAVRQVVRNGALVPLLVPAPTGRWTFPDPIGDQPVVQLPLSEIILIVQHLEVEQLSTVMNIAPLNALEDEGTPPPSAADERGRSIQQFVVDVTVRCGSDIRRITSSGRDIYAITAPIVVEGAVRLLDGRHHGPGAGAPGEVFDANDVLAALATDSNGLLVRRDFLSTPAIAAESRLREPSL